jgi:protoheme IX farnesyltransferase
MVARLAAWFEVTKPRVVALIVVTALIGMLLSVPGAVPLGPLVWGTLGIWLAAASAAALNQLIDRRTDALMSRTAQRPLPTGAVSTREVLLLALVLGNASMLLLWQMVNPLTAVLTFCSLIGYAVVYTMWLKRATPQNIVIGGAAGAAPPLLGWAAVRNEVDAGALLLFLIIFTWTPPHFWALAIHRRDDYAKVDVPMLPVTHGVPFTHMHVVFYTILLVLVSLLPYLIGMSGPLYLIGALSLGIVYLAHAVSLLKDDTMPMRAFGFSLIYLAGIFTFLLADHYLVVIKHA